MSSQLSAQAITAHTAITRIASRRCRILPRQRRSSTAPKCCTRLLIVMTCLSIRKADHHASNPVRQAKAEGQAGGACCADAEGHPVGETEKTGGVDPATNKDVFPLENLFPCDPR